MSTEQKYAPRDSYAIASPQAAKKPQKKTSRPYEGPTLSPEDLTAEQCRQIVGYESRYEVSDMGRIKSLPQGSITIRRGGYGQHAGGIRKTLVNRSYESINLKKDGTQKLVQIHRLVALAFIPNPVQKPQVNNIDGNSLNNKAINLEWVTGIENIHHAIRTGLIFRKPKRTSTPPVSQVLPRVTRRPAVIPAHIANSVIDEYFNRPNGPISQHQLCIKYGLSASKVRRILRQHSKSNRHDQQMLDSLLSDYRVRKSIGLTTGSIAQRYGLSVQAVRKIVARAGNKQRRTNSLTS